MRETLMGLQLCQNVEKIYKKNRLKYYTIPVMTLYFGRLKESCIKERNILDTEKLIKIGRDMETSLEIAL